MPSAETQRAQALARYHADPRICKECNKAISVKDGQTAREVRKKDFCDRVCSALYTNRHHPRRRGPLRKARLCRGCQTPHFTGTAFCSSNCRDNFKDQRPNLGDRTKADLFSNCATWQAARSTIQRHARRSFFGIYPNASCVVCGYAVHVEVAHRVPVADFPDATPISKINDISNLVGLCPNHHWEHDNGLLSLNK
jgi:hypothetical protein